VRASTAAAALAVVLAVAFLSACGDSSTATSGPRSETTVAGPAGGQAGLGKLTAAELRPSVEAQVAGFLERKGSALAASLRHFLGDKVTTRVEPGSAICRPGGETPSISDPSRYPFACIVRASADGQGLQVGITLGFVGTKLDGRCWRAANERVSVTTSPPALLDRREAMRPVNGIAGCA
jgi:hypothetical protein